MNRILFFNYEFPPIGGGSGNANAYLFREFSRRDGLAIDCVTSNLDREDEVFPLHDRIRLHRLAVGKKDLHFWAQRELATYLFRAGGKAKDLLAVNGYDLCHAFGGFPAGLLAWRLRRRAPYILSLRGSDVPGFNPRFKWQYAVLQPLFRRIWRGARSVTATSAGLRQLAQKFEPSLAVEVIPNGVDAEEFSPAEPGGREPGLLLCVSRLIERKGVQHLVAAFPEVLRRDPSARLTIVGSGDLEGALRDQVRQLGCQEKISFAGEIEHAALPEFYRRAQVFVQPSYSEGMSNTVLEAMACGLPVVVSAEGGRQELCGANAAMVSFGDHHALGRILAELLGRPERLAAMGAESRSIAEGYSWQAAAERYLELYRKVLENPTKAAKT